MIQVHCRFLREKRSGSKVHACLWSGCPGLWRLFVSKTHVLAEVGIVLIGPLHGR